MAITQDLFPAAEIGVKEYDRLTLARAMMDRELDWGGGEAEVWLQATCN